MKKLALFFVAFLTFAGVVTLLNLSVPVQADTINNTDFVITVKTDNLSTGSSADNQFTIPTIGTGYNYTVDCNNDGVHEVTGQTANYTCTYPNPGTYTLRIGGTFPRIYFFNSNDKLKLLEVNQWGVGAWTSMNSAFYGAANMDVTALDTPNLMSANNIGQMFRGATSLTGLNGNWGWHLTNITSTAAMFYGASNFNGPVSSWDVSNVTTMNSMFSAATRFNQPISNWDTSKVTDMAYMFNGAANFNQFIGDWDTGSAVNMNNMFSSASNFNQNIGEWNTTNVTDMSYMFRSASAFNNGQLAGESTAPLNWDTTRVTLMHGMFNSASVFNQPIGGWNTSNATDMQSMFNNASSFNNGQPAGESTAPLNWDTSNVKNVQYIFSAASAFSQPIGNWDMRSVTNATSMFAGAKLSTPQLRRYTKVLVHPRITT